LCVFDIDRTLTGKQGDMASCPEDAIQPGISDWAYGGGTLTLSQLALNLAGTFCHGCHLATISAGSAAGEGSDERARLYEKLSEGGDLPVSVWNAGGCTVQDSPLVTGCADGNKQNAIPGIQQWYKSNSGANIADSDVYFFDDRSMNVAPFKNLPYNARQISCETRDLSGSIGLCGARLSEVQRVAGVHLCSGAAGDVSVIEVADGHYVNTTSTWNSLII
jgi:hypothetical protein